MDSAVMIIFLSFYMASTLLMLSVIIYLQCRFRDKSPPPQLEEEKVYAEIPAQLLRSQKC